MLFTSLSVVIFYLVIPHQIAAWGFWWVLLFFLDVPRPKKIDQCTGVKELLITIWLATVYLLEPSPIVFLYIELIILIIQSFFFSIWKQRQQTIEQIHTPKQKKRKKNNGTAKQCDEPNCLVKKNFRLFINLFI